MCKPAIVRRGSSRGASSKDPIMTKGSENPFADLGFVSPDLELAKSRLVMEIAKGN